jgi:hypothetical protein
MSDQEKKQETSISPQLNTDDNKDTGELSEEELKKVAGGADSMPTESVKFDYGTIKWTYTQQG